MAKRTGVSTGGIETSPRYERKRARERRDEQASWAAQNGPITLRIGEHSVVAASGSRRDIAAARSALEELIAAEELSA